MGRSILTVIGIAAVALIVAAYVYDNPRILWGVADAALARCEVSALLYEKLVEIGLNQYQMATLDAIMQGKEVAVRDVRDIDGHVRHAVNVAKSGMVCWVVGR